VIRRLVTVLAATLAGVAAGPALLAAPAHAAACRAGTGVTVVVGSSVGCDPDGGGRAAQNFADAGHQLTYATRAPGFVCRVDGAPADATCVEASPPDAYWALFWSDGKSGEWVYSSLGVTGLKVPQGGAVAFVFQRSESRTWPSVPAPVAAAPAPTQATPRPDGPRATEPGSAGSKPSARRSTAPRASAPDAAPVPGASSSAPTASVPTASASATATAHPTSAPTPGATTSAGEDASAAEEGEEVMPLAATDDGGTSAAAIAAGAGVVALLGVAGAVAWRRRNGA